MFIVDNPRTVIVHHLSVERQKLQERLTQLKIKKRMVELNSSSLWSVENQSYKQDVIELIFVQSRVDEIDSQIKKHLKF